MRSFSPRGLTAAVALLTAVVLGACSANPGPAPVENVAPASLVSTTSAAAVDTEAARSTIAIGIDELRNGFNPHLRADDTEFISELADLVLPSAFRNGELNHDLLLSAEEIEPTPSTSTEQGEAPTVASVRYVINPAAQWSDGTPVSGADFEYLWRSMISTPGVIDAAAYQSISQVRSSNGGKTVTVDFSQPLAQWRDLFSHLIPAHLAQNSSFETVLQNTIPASAGKFLVAQVDRSRGSIELNRNDRYWGESPAAVEILRFVEVRDQVTVSDQLRTGQLSFVDVTPTQTLGEALSLVPGAQTRTVSTGRQLQLIWNTLAVTDPEIRAALSSLLDVPLIARLATGRDLDLSLPENTRTSSTASPLVPTLSQPLRIAADPADSTAAAAVRAIIDELAQQGITAEVVAADMATLTAKDLPDGTVDAVVTWGSADPDAIDVASFYGCLNTELNTTDTASAAPDPEGTGLLPGASNLSAFCEANTQETLATLLAGESGAPAAVAAEIEAREHLSLPLLNETRLQVLGSGIVGPKPQLADWSAGIPTADTWQESVAQEPKTTP